jgi:hypothetical protein
MAVPVCPGCSHSLAPPGQSCPQLHRLPRTGGRHLTPDPGRAAHASGFRRCQVIGWSSTQDAASTSARAAARACAEVSIDPCSASTQTTTSPSSFCPVAISTEVPSLVWMVGHRGPSWLPGSRSQSACLVRHQLGQESHSKRSAALVMVLVYLLSLRPRRRMTRLPPDRESCGGRRHGPRLPH